ncbi:unnamed protein product [Laminaria digitata]
MSEESELFRQHSEEVRMERFAEVEAAQEDELNKLLRRRLQHMRMVEAESHLLRLQHEAEVTRMQFQQQQHAGAVWAGNTGRGGISRSLLRREKASMGVCERCGAQGHRAAICRAPNAFAGACHPGEAYGHVARQCHTVPAPRVHARFRERF